MIHPRLEQLRAMAGRAYQPERSLTGRSGPVKAGQPVFGGGHAGLVNTVAHNGAKRSKIADQRTKAATVGLSVPTVLPGAHCNGSRRHSGGRA